MRVPLRNSLLIFLAFRHFSSQLQMEVSENGDTMGYPNHPFSIISQPFGDPHDYWVTLLSSAQLRWLCPSNLRQNSRTRGPKLERHLASGSYWSNEDGASHDKLQHCKNAVNKQ